MEPSFRPPTFDAMGTPIAATSIAEVAGLVRQWAKDGLGRFIGVRDVASTVALHNDPALHDIGAKAALNLEPPHLNWSTAMFRKWRTENGEQATEAGRDSIEVTAS